MTLHHRWEIEATRDRALIDPYADRIASVRAMGDTHSVVLERVDVLALLDAYRRRGEAIEALARMAAENADKAEELRRSNGALQANLARRR